MYNKPLIFLGNGCRGNKKLINDIEKLNVPVLLSWMALDILPEDSSVFCGRPGVLGQRGANILLQKCDVLYIFGARCDNDTVAFRLDNFARNAKKIIYDVDIAELNKFPDDWEKYRFDLSQDIGFSIEPNLDWLHWAKSLHCSFLSEIEGKDNDRFVDPMKLVYEISNEMIPNDNLALGSSGTAPCTFLQGFKVKRGQRVTGLSTIGTMGSDIGMGIGVCLGSGKRRTIIATGDGSLAMNSTELEVMSRLNLPIKILLYNNQGFSSIRNMQNARFDGNHVACDVDSGLYLPNYQKLAFAHNLKYRKVQKMSQWQGLLDNEPEMIEFMIDPDFTQLPKVASSLIDGKFVTDDISDMTPKLSREEYNGIMNY